MEEKEYDKCSTNLEKCLKITKQVFGEVHVETAKIYNMLGNLYEIKGEFPKSLYCHEQAFANFKSTLGEKANDTIVSKNNYGNALLNLGEYKKAIDCLLECSEISNLVYGEDPHIQKAKTYSILSNVYRNMMENQKALVYLKKSIDIDDALGNPEKVTTALIHNNMGLVLTALKDFSNSLVHLERALKISKEIYGDYHSRTSTNLNNIGLVYLELNDYAKAREYLEKSLEVSIHLFGESHPETLAS
jgi:tetratricopeptide (TPR) repeat protein